MAEAVRLRRGDRGLAGWQTWFEQELELRLDELVLEHPEYAAVAEALQVLPAGHRASFLRSPSVSSVLFHGGDAPADGAGLLERLLMGELVVLGLLPQLPDEAHWTADGSQRLPALPEEHQYRSIRGLPNVALDLASPFRFPDDEYGIAGGTVPYEAADLENAVERVSAATGVLESIPPALELVDTFTETLALRREPAAERGFQSSTFSGLVGLVRLANADLPGVSPGLVAEALVHEATHGMLYMHEEVDGPFITDESANHEGVESPWTGTTIRLQSLLHACAVWLAIHSYWQRALVADSCDAAEARRSSDLALGGFRARPAAELVDRHLALLSPAAVELLERLDAAMVELV